MKCKFLFLFLLFFGHQGDAFSLEPSLEQTTEELENKVNRLESQVRHLEDAQTTAESEISQLQESIERNGLALILFGVFCAWWAKTTGRSALLWFFLGLLFHVFSGIALLIKTQRST
ncbi:hypothetical protein OAP14_05875 [Aliiglaciecola sp.]|nr:hypothetical protein [Aliiglaciecola sp.]